MDGNISEGCKQVDQDSKYVLEYASWRIQMPRGNDVLGFEDSNCSNEIAENEAKPLSSYFFSSQESAIIPDAADPKESEPSFASLGGSSLSKQTSDSRC